MKQDDAECSPRMTHGHLQINHCVTGWSSTVTEWTDVHNEDECGSNGNGNSNSTATARTLAMTIAEAKQRWVTPWRKESSIVDCRLS